MRVRSSRPLAASHSFTVLSSLPETIVRPSGENATAIDPIAMPRERAQLAPARRVPQLQRLVGAPRDDRAPVRRERDGMHPENYAP